MTFALPSADCGACRSSMRFMIAERQDESLAAAGRPLMPRSARRLTSEATSWSSAARLPIRAPCALAWSATGAVDGSARRSARTPSGPGQSGPASWCELGQYQNRGRVREALAHRLSAYGQRYPFGPLTAMGASGRPASLRASLTGYRRSGSFQGFLDGPRTASRRPQRDHLLPIMTDGALQTITSLN
jgi:hypothetical protein